MTENASTSAATAVGVLAGGVATVLALRHLYRRRINAVSGTSAAVPAGLKELELGRQHPMAIVCNYLPMHPTVPIILPISVRALSGIELRRVARSHILVPLIGSCSNQLK